MITSSVHNARGLVDLAAPLRDDPELQGLRAMVDGGLSIFHGLRKVTSPALRRRLYRQLRRDGVLPCSGTTPRKSRSAAASRAPG